MVLRHTDSDRSAQLEYQNRDQPVGDDPWESEIKAFIVVFNFRVQ